MKASSDSVIWMPFAYRAKVAKPQRRVDDRSVIAGRVPVSPPKIRTEDASIAAITGKEIYRHRDGMWLRPVRLPDGSPLKTIDFDQLAGGSDRALVAWEDYPLHDVHAGLPYSPFADGVEFEDALPPDWTVKSSERGIREGFAVSASDSLCDVAGVLWRSCPEPFLAVRAEGANVLGDIVVEVVERQDRSADCAFFSIDQASEASSYAVEMARVFGKAKPSPLKLELKDVPSLKFDASTAMAARIAWVLEEKRRRAWFNPKDAAAEDPSRSGLLRLVAAVDLHAPKGDPFPVLASASDFLFSPVRSGRSSEFIRRAYLQIMAGKLRRWAADHEGALTMSGEDDAAIAGMTTVGTKI